MILYLLFQALWLILSFCVVATVVVFYAAFWILAFLVAVVIEIISAISRRRRLRNPKSPKWKPIPQARWSNRR